MNMISRAVFCNPDKFGNRNLESVFAMSLDIKL